MVNAYKIEFRAFSAKSTVRILKKEDFIIFKYL
jgi:hypothetical protein